MSDHSHAHSHGHAHDPAKESRAYLFTLLALLALTFVTVGASYIHFGSGIFNVVVALGIATVKASLVGLVFMHLRHDKPLNSVIFVSSFAFLFLFLLLTYADIVTRDPLEPTKLPNMAKPTPALSSAPAASQPPAAATPAPTATPAPATPATAPASPGH